MRDPNCNHAVPQIQSLCVVKTLVAAVASSQGAIDFVLKGSDLPDILSGVKTIAARQISKNWSAVLKNNAGAELAITNRGEVVAYLRVLPRQKGEKATIPDFRKRIEARFGKRMLKPDDVSWLDEAMKSRY